MELALMRYFGSTGPHVRLGASMQKHLLTTEIAFNQSVPLCKMVVWKGPEKSSKKKKRSEFDVRSEFV